MVQDVHEVVGGDVGVLGSLHEGRFGDFGALLLHWFSELVLEVLCFGHLLVDIDSSSDVNFIFFDQISE